jgi:hypothetical protein
MPTGNELKQEDRPDGGVIVTRASDGIELKLGVPGLEVARPDAAADPKRSDDDAAGDGSADGE